MATQTGSIDLKSAKKAHDDAEKVATNFVSDFSNGILVHPENDTDNGVKITDKVEIMRGSGGSSESVAEFSTSVRVGQNASGKSRTVIDPDGMRIIRNVVGEDIQIADLGYGSGNDSGGALANSPYFSIGGRVTRLGSYYNYDPTATYSRGDLCWYNNEVHVCSVDITTPEQWTSSHWKAAIGNYSVTLAQASVASGYASVAEGASTRAVGDCSHAEGDSTVASGGCSHAEGINTAGRGVYSHAEGGTTVASGSYSHAEGGSTVASGIYSHAQNYYTIAQRKSQTAIGEYNIADNIGNVSTRGSYSFIIGNGTMSNNRSNALTVDWDGNVFLALDTNAGSGTDHDLYAAITALGWGSDVIV